MKTEDSRKSPPELGGRKGVALIMVLVVVTILTVVSVEFQYESRVYLQTVANFRDRTRALYLARSAIEFSRLLFTLQSTVDQMLQRFMKNNAPNIQLWQMIPIDSDLAKAITGGLFTMQDHQEAFEGTVLGAGMNQEDSVANQQAANTQPLAFDQAEGFGEFDGHFHAEIKDEESKINVNIRPGNFQEKNLMQAELERLFAPVKYDPLFENPDKNGQYHDRQEIIAAIVDWIDPDEQRQGFQSGDEATRYDMLDPPYPSRNHLMDTLDELQMVSGIDDRFWRLFSEQLTIYRTAKINVNTCGVEVLRALLEQYLEPPIPQDDEMIRIIDTIMDFRLQNAGFWNEDAFLNFLTAGPELFLELKDGAKGKANLKKVITVKSGTFTIKAEGDVNGVLRTIKVVMTMEGRLLYYREE